MLKIKSKRQGAELTSILKDENEMLFDGKTFWNRQSPILFPIVGQIKEGKTQYWYQAIPGDHGTEVGAAIQKYMSGNIDREELAAEVENYWKGQE